MERRVKVVQNHTPIDKTRVDKSNKGLKEVQNWNNNSNKIMPQYVRKKWSLIKFKRMIKKGGFTSARLASKTLGVDKRTIEKWLKLPVIQKALLSDIANYTKQIKKSKDWKAQAYLLDKTLDISEDKTPINDLKQVIVINT